VVGLDVAHWERRFQAVVLSDLAITDRVLPGMQSGMIRVDSGPVRAI
jgi:hypothetical protein